MILVIVIAVDGGGIRIIREGEVVGREGYNLHNMVSVDDKQVIFGVQHNSVSV